MAQLTVETAYVFQEISEKIYGNTKINHSQIFEKAAKKMRDLSNNFEEAQNTHNRIRISDQSSDLSLLRNNLYTELRIKTRAAKRLQYTLEAISELNQVQHAAQQTIDAIQSNTSTLGELPTTYINRFASIENNFQNRRSELLKESMEDLKIHESIDNTEFHHKFSLNNEIKGITSSMGILNIKFRSQRSFTPTKLAIEWSKFQRKTPKDRAYALLSSHYNDCTETNQHLIEFFNKIEQLNKKFSDPNHSMAADLYKICENQKRANFFLMVELNNQMAKIKNDKGETINTSTAEGTSTSKKEPQKKKKNRK